MNEVLKALLLRKLAGRGGGGGYPEPTGTKQITANGTGIDVKDFATADVNVPNTYAAGDEGKVVQSGALVSQTQKSVNANGTYDTTANNSVVVDVPTGELKEYTSSAIPKSTFKTWANTFNSGSTMTVALAPTDGTTVEVGDEVLVHGTIISTAGTSFKYYVTGEVTSFDSSNKPVITVKGLGQPSPIADGTMIVNSNGTHDIKEYASITVNVRGDGTTYITENGTHDVGGYRYANVNVESGGGDVKILFATDATYNDEPIQGGSCSAEVPTADLSSYSEGDKVVLYGEEPNMTGKNYLVVGTITSFNFPSAVYFDVEEVSEISGGGGKGGSIALVASAFLDTDPSLGKGTSIGVSPDDVADITDVNVGDPALIFGSYEGDGYVFSGIITNNTGSSITVEVRDQVSAMSNQPAKSSGGSFSSHPDKGTSQTYYPDDSSILSGITSNDYIICSGEAGGENVAVFGTVLSVDVGNSSCYIDVALMDNFL